jgi:hypothetical protein
MATPKTAISRFDISIRFSEFNLLANRAGFIGLMVLPALAVALQSAAFLRVKVESLLGPVEDLMRAPRGTYKRSNFEWDQDNYATADYGAEEEVDDRQIAMYGDILRAEQINLMRAINRVLQCHESEVAQAVFDTATWTGASLTTALSTPWSTPASATPLEDVDAAIEKVKNNIGTEPDTFIMTDWALRKLSRTAEVKDLLKYSGHDDPKALDVIAGLAQLFKIPKWRIGKGWKNAASVGLDPSFSRLWDPTMAMVCKTADEGDEDLESATPSIGRTVCWTEENAGIPGVDAQELAVIVEEYREEQRRGGVIRARHDRQIKILHPKAGHLLTNVTA